MVRYLRIMADKNFKNVYKFNYTALSNEIIMELQKLTNSSITLLGRINCVKMNILPLLQYFFESLPIPVPDSFFNTTLQHLNIFDSSYGMVRLQVFLWRNFHVIINWAVVDCLVLKSVVWLPKCDLYLFFLRSKVFPHWACTVMYAFKETVTGDFLHKWTGLELITLFLHSLIKCGKYGKTNVLD